MRDLSLDRMLLGAGLVYIVLQGVAFAVLPAQPATTAGADEVTAYFGANRDVFGVVLYITALAQVVLLWFLGGLRIFLGRLEGAGHALARVAHASGLMAASMLFATTIVSGALTVRPVSAPGRETMLAVFDMFNFGFGMSGLPLGGLLIAAGLVLLRARAWTWLGWLGVLAGALQLISTLGVVVDGGPLALGGPVENISDVLMLGWIALASVVFWRRSAWERVSALRPEVTA